MTEYIDGSPCIAVCTLGADDHCEGCGRSRDEIRTWRHMNSVEKDQINRRLLTEAHPAVRFRLLGDAGPGDGKRKGGRKARRGQKPL